MRKNCGIIKDLIPMYVENLTSEESNQFIKEHLHSCKNCTDFLKNANSDLPNDDLLVIDMDIDDKRIMKGIKRRMKNIVFIAILMGVLLGLGISLLFFNLALVGFVSFLLLIVSLIYLLNNNKERKIQRGNKDD
ncbi:zf-HC2 domain-containing protein [Bacillus sp. JJ1562]|uniref:zf-HC2 domain-containing protein n=1 Tax=Bacillus sp. JJ1562 TaxID=3122960 RepID=UPI003002AFCB